MSIEEKIGIIAALAGGPPRASFSGAVGVERGKSTFSESVMGGKSSFGEKSVDMEGLIETGRLSPSYFHDDKVGPSLSSDTTGSFSGASGSNNNSFSEPGQSNGKEDFILTDVQDGKDVLRATTELPFVELFNSLAVGACVVSASKGVVLVNPVFEKMFGISAKEAQGMKIVQFVDTASQQLLSGKILHDTQDTYRVLGRRQDSNITFLVDVNCKLVGNFRVVYWTVKSASGKQRPLAFLLTSTVTELQTVVKQIIKSAHAPRSDGPNTTLIHASVLSSMLSKLDIYLKLQSGLFTPQPQRIDIRQVIDHTLSEIYKEKNDFELACLVQQEVPEFVEADSFAVGQVLRNVFAIGMGKEVLMNVSVQSESVAHLVLKFEISGFSGISSLPRFESLCIPIARTLVEQMDGTFDVSQGMERMSFSSFTIKVRKASVRKGKSDKVKVHCIRRRILVIEQSYNIGQIIKTYLEFLKCSADVIFSPQEISQSLRRAAKERKPYDCLLVDLSELSKEYETMIRNLRSSEYWHLPVVVLQGSSDNRSRHPISVGCDAFLSKPITGYSTLYGTLAKMFLKTSGREFDKTDNSHSPPAVNSLSTSSSPLPQSGSACGSSSSSTSSSFSAKSSSGPPHDFPSSICTSSPDSTKEEPRESLKRPRSENSTSEPPKKKVKKSRSRSKNLLNDSNVSPNRRVLVVDDNRASQAVLRSAVHKMNLRVGIDLADDGIEALALYKANPYAYCLILMDTMMPRMDGFQAAEEIRKFERSINRKVPIVAVTAIGTGKEGLENAEEHCKFSGMDGYLEKPVSIPILRKRILHHIGGPEKNVEIPSLQVLMTAHVSTMIRKGRIKELPSTVDEKVVQDMIDVMARDKASITTDTIRVFSNSSPTRFTIFPHPPCMVNQIVNEMNRRCVKWKDSLTELDLSGCTFLTDRAMMCLSEFRSLRALNLSYCSHITDRGLVNLLKLKNLQKIDLRGCNLLTEVGKSILDTMDLEVLMYNNMDVS